MINQRMTIRFNLLLTLMLFAVVTQGQQARYRNEEAAWNQLGEEVARLQVFANNDYLTNIRVENNLLHPTNLPRPNKKKQDSEAIYSGNKRAVLQLCYSYKCGKCNNNHVNPSATAFFITEDGLAVTNYHVLESFIQGKRDNGQLDLSKILQEENKSQMQDMHIFFSTYDNQIYTLKEILAYDKTNDLAIFRLDTKGEKTPATKLGNAAEVGAKAFVISHPNSNPYYFSQGLVARNYAFNKGIRMDITADYAKGSSGGPIFDDLGNVIGVVSATHTITYKDDASTANDVQMVIKRAIPVDAIKKLLL